MDFSSAISFGSQIFGGVFIAPEGGIQGVVYASDSMMKMFDYTINPPTVLNSLAINIGFAGMGNSQNSEKLVLGDSNLNKIYVYGTTSWNLIKTFSISKNYLQQIEVIPSTGKVFAITTDDYSNTLYSELFNIALNSHTVLSLEQDSQSFINFAPVNTFNTLFTVFQDHSVQFFDLNDYVSIWNDSEINFYTDVHSVASEQTQDKFLIAIENSYIHIFEKTDTYCNGKLMIKDSGACKQCNTLANHAPN